ncbi:MAG: type IV secretion system protein [Pseudomonadota bacterium]|nr:type IV secretion system protein [Pseudomonadota bacterium]
MSIAACSPVASGSGFLKSSLAYLDCAGQAIGSTGFTALTQPGTVISQLILAAITLFIAWHGVRMMFGQMPDMGDAVLAVAKIGLVLMLVTSWPAVRTLFADPAFRGPSELVTQSRVLGPVAIEDRLQRVDDGIVALTRWGTGKLDIRAGRTAEGRPAATEFAGVALTDNLALGLGRLSLLIGTLMSLGLLKLLSGIMIAALPIFAGLLLFDVTRALFLGWLKLVFALFVASFAVPLLLTAELALLEPLLARAIEQRAAFLATPSAPTELWAITGSFLLILTGSIALIGRACLSVDLAVVAGRISGEQRQVVDADVAATRPAQLAAPGDRAMGLSRAESLAMTISRLDQSPRSFAAQAGSMPRCPDNDASPNSIGGRHRHASRQRARQRTALSHVRRNQL